MESLKRIASVCAEDSTGEGGKVLLVTSVAENEGKSTLAANLALAFQRNRTVSFCWTVIFVSRRCIRFLNFRKRPERFRTGSSRKGVGVQRF